MKEVNYKKASFFYLVGNLFNKGIVFLTVPVFTRLLSTSDYGVVTTYNSWVTILSMITSFAMYMAIRAAFVDYRNKIDDFMSVSTTFTLMIGGCLFVVIGGIGLIVKNKAIVYLFLICVSHGLSAALIENYSMYLMMQYKYKFRTILMVLPSLISVIVSILAIWLFVEKDLYLGRIIPTALVYCGFGLMTVVLVYKRSHIMISVEFLKYGLAISTPLVLHGIALNLLSQSDRTMITIFRDTSETGIYSLIYNFSMIATVITTSLDGVWVPWFTDKIKNRDLNKINCVAKDYINLMTFAMIGVILAGPEIVKILAAEQYWEGIDLIPPVVLSNYIIFAYTLYVNIEHFYKKTIFITINTLIAAATNLVLNFLFIPRFGYIAAAFTTLISYFIAFVLHANYAKKLDKDLYPFRFFIAPFIQIAIAVIMFYIFKNVPILRWGLMILYIAVTCFINKRWLRYIVSTNGKFD